MAPTVVVCIDGSEPGYIEAAIARGVAPNLDRLLKTGSHRLAHSVVPSFSNPNNISIITGRPPAVHRIAGNYFYDRAAGEEVPIIVNRRVDWLEGQLRNFDVFDVALNRVAAGCAGP